MPEFRVVIDGRLTAKQQQALNQSIQRAVLAQVADWDDYPPCGIYIPPRRWNGLVARPLSEKVVVQEFREFP